MTLRTILWASLILMGLGGAAFWLTSSTPSSSPTPGRPPQGMGVSATEPSRIDAAATAASPTPPSESLLPAWAKAASPTGAAAQRGAAGGQIQDEQALRLQRIKAAAERLRDAGESGQSPQTVLAALKDLEAANGGAQLAGIDLTVMRKNMEVAMKMQEKAQELSQLQQQYQRGDKQASKERMEALVKEMRALQSQVVLSKANPVTPSSLTQR